MKNFDFNRKKETKKPVNKLKIMLLLSCLLVMVLAEGVAAGKFTINYFGDTKPTAKVKNVTLKKQDLKKSYETVEKNTKKALKSLVTSGTLNKSEINGSLVSLSGGTYEGGFYPVVQSVSTTKMNSKSEVTYTYKIVYVLSNTRLKGKTNCVDTFKDSIVSPNSPNAKTFKYDKKTGLYKCGKDVYGIPKTYKYTVKSSIKLNSTYKNEGKKVELGVGESAYLDYYYDCILVKGDKLTATSSDSDVIKVSKVSGKYVKVKALKKGSATITIKTTKGLSIKVKVSASPYLYVETTDYDEDFTVGSTYKMMYDVIDDIYYISGDKIASLTSSNTDVVTIGSYSTKKDLWDALESTKLYCKSAGTAKITLKTTFGASKTFYVTVVADEE